MSAAARRRGYSLLELVVVILIVCVLLAVALPRYRDAQRFARIALLDNMALLMHSAIDGFHRQCLALQMREPQADCAELRVGRVLVRGEGGYPQAGLDGIGRLVGLGPGDPAAGQFVSEATRHEGHPALKLTLKHAEDGTCVLLYRAPAGVGERPEVLVLQSTCP